jgi:hypothetical protein
MSVMLNRSIGYSLTTVQMPVKVSPNFSFVSESKMPIFNNMSDSDPPSTSYVYSSIVFSPGSNACFTFYAGLLMLSSLSSVLIGQGSEV